MLTPEQEKWLSHLASDDHTEIHPYDSAAPDKFEKVKDKIIEALGEGWEVIHRGASSLLISGQGELDIYIPVAVEKFNTVVRSLELPFGIAESHYPLERARFVTMVDGTKAEIFVINEKSEGWINGTIFENFLRENRDALDAYRILKERSRGLSTREYYRRKIEFINNIVGLVKESK
jgi:GrpB-like predicted nucleotidyltransferase (UPF0157 family)